MAKLRLVHVSDMHLFVEADGAARPVTELSRLATAASRVAQRFPNAPLLSGFNTHDGDALDALVRAVNEQIDNADDQIAIIQTGDISTFGSRGSGSVLSFPEWEYWMGWPGFPRARSADHWINVYGNHDVWPGTLPGAAPHKVDAARDGLRDVFYRYQFPERMEVNVGADRVEIYTINTVQHEAVENTAARGLIEFDHHDRTAPREYPCRATHQLTRVSSLARQHLPADPAKQNRVLRILVMHHPPEMFGAPRGAIPAARHATKNGPLVNEAELRTWLEQQRMKDTPFALVLAGHRHELDPRRNRHPTYLPGTRTYQLVCGSPTQLGGEHSFSVYDITFDASPYDAARVKRIVYTRGATDIDFAPEAIEPIM